MKTIRIGMIGLGTVGGGTAAMLEKNRGFINKTANANIVMDKILVYTSGTKITVRYMMYRSFRRK